MNSKNEITRTVSWEVRKKINVLQRAVYVLITVTFLGLFTTSCKDELEDIEATETVELKAFETQVEVEKATESINNIVEDTFYFEEISAKNDNLQNRFRPDCLIITRIIIGNTKTLTLDFGTGCEMPNGNILSGIITMEYTLNMMEQSKTIQVSFTNFYFNAKNVAGSTTIVRQRQNLNGNPQSMHSVNITLTWPDGTFASRNGQKTREWIEGFGSPHWGDNVYLITGNWTFVRRNGTVLIATITTPLRRELSCRFIVSGVLELNKNGNVATLDYGNGDCDVLGIVTINGMDHQIHLRRL